MDLSARKQQILRAVIENYIETAEPVGSKSLLESGGLDVSSATVRSEMAELEALGLLEQPHTSAGRVPSPTGYRLYVNELMRQHRLSLQETQRINEALHLKMAELERVIGEASRVVSQLTRYPAFSLSAGSEQTTIRRFDLLVVEEHSFLAILMTDQNVVRHKLFRLPADLTDGELALLNAFLNATFTGLTLAQITPELLRMAAATAADAYGLIALVVSFSMEVLEEQERRWVHTAGITNLLSHPEYRSLDKAQALMDYLSEERNPERFPAIFREDSKILIGPENVADALKDTSVVVASYDIGAGMRGIIGVVGPTRMDYAKMTARLTYFAEGLSRLFGQGELEDKHKDKEDNSP